MLALFYSLGQCCTRLCEPEATRRRGETSARERIGADEADESMAAARRADECGVEGKYFLFIATIAISQWFLQEIGDVPTWSRAIETDLNIINDTLMRVHNE